MGDHFIAPPASQSYYQLRNYPDQCLKEPCVPVLPTTLLDDDLIPRMKEILEQHRGLGLAAQQVGSCWAVALMRLTTFGIDDIRSSFSKPLDDQLPRFVIVTINPRIVKKSPEMSVHIGEGCLSAQSSDGVSFRTSVRRHQWVVMEWQNEQRETRKRKFIGLDAVIIQHELDHLAGKCIVDGLERPQRRQLHRLLGIA